MVILIAISVITYVQLKRKTITVIIDDKRKDIVTYKDTVGAALEDNEISLAPKDKIEPKVDSEIKDKDTITIKKAVNVKIAVDGKSIPVQSAENNVASLLKEEGIALNDKDKVTPDINSNLCEGMEVAVTRVETKNFTESIPIAYKEVVKKDNTLPNTTKKVAQEGKKGEKQITTSVVYENGVEVARKVIKEVVAKKPVDKITILGTLPVVPVSRGGSSMAYGKVLKVKSTAYWAVNGVGKTYTASGRKAVRNPEGYSTIAVDPKVIPYGTRLFVEGYGLAIAADTGTAIKGNKIDVYFNTYGEACKWGVKYVNVYVLR